MLLDSAGSIFEPRALAARVTRLRQRGTPKIVVTSAHADRLRDESDLGVDAVLAKPFEIGELIAFVRGVAGT